MLRHPKPSNDQSLLHSTVPESGNVRRALTQTRVPAATPVPLIYVLRVLFSSVYGIFRQLTCPIYGLTHDLVVRLCQDSLTVNRALSAVVAQGPYWFTGLRREAAETLRYQLTSEIAHVRDGRGPNIVHSVMQWVKTVQFRALQDHAAARPEEFQTAWCVTDCAVWSDYFKGWAETLALREDRDIGWVASTKTAVWSHSAGAMREDIQRRVRDLGRCMAEEDDIRWREGVADSVVHTKEGTHTDVLSCRKEERVGLGGRVHYRPGENSVTMATSGIGDRAHTTPAQEDSAYPAGTGQADQIHMHGDCIGVGGLPVTLTDIGDVDSSLPSVLAGATKTGLQGLRNDDEHTVILPPPTAGFETSDDPYALNFEATQAVQCPPPAGFSNAKSPCGEGGVHRYEETSKAASGSSSFDRDEVPVPAGLLLGLEHALDAENISPGAADVISVTQVQNLAHDVPDISVEGTQFDVPRSSQCPPVSHLTEQTPPNGASLVWVRDSDGDGAGPSTPCENLSAKFETHREEEAVTELVGLSEGIQPRGWDEEASAAVGALHVMGPLLSYCGISDIPSVFYTMPLPQLYSTVEIEKTLKKVSAGGQGSRKLERVVFFNHVNKEFEIPFKHIRSLKRSSAWLGHDIMDFVLSRMYMKYPAEYRQEVHVVSSFATGALQGVMNSGNGMLKFAEKFLQPRSPYHARQVSELIVPWITEMHWSLLILHLDRWWHLDSMTGTLHFPTGKHADILRWLYACWQTLRGDIQHPLEEHSHVLQVYQQPGNDECGHCCIRNVQIYLKVYPRP